MSTKKWVCEDFVDYYCVEYEGEWASKSGQKL